MGTQVVRDPLVALALKIGSAVRLEVNKAGLAATELSHTLSLKTDTGDTLWVTYKGIPPFVTCTISINDNFVDVFYGHPEIGS